MTNAQGTAVFKVGDQVVWLGNQWNTGPRRNADLLYWARLEFDAGSSRNRGSRAAHVLPLAWSAAARLVPWETSNGKRMSMRGRDQTHGSTQDIEVTESGSQTESQTRIIM